jgi:UDP-N-acetylglucosamine/UDP-N-acetylgalactosamine diphosphorylase
MEKKAVLEAKLKQYNQTHLLAFWDELSQKEREKLSSQIEKIDFSHISQLFKKPSPKIYKESISPLPSEVVFSKTSFPNDEYFNLGQAALRAGKVAFFLVAGGQSSRLGLKEKISKGEIPITPVTKKSLFCLLCEKIRAVEIEYNSSFPLYIMTNQSTHSSIIDYFKKENNFGLKEVYFIPQSMLPALDFAGRILMESKSSIFWAPTGHGSALEIMFDILPRLKEREIEHIFYFQVDNPLVNIGDEIFLGLHILKNADISLKVIRKRTEREKLGVITFDKNLGRYKVIEYSELPEEYAKLRDAQGNLLFWAGSIAVHLIKTEFLNKLKEKGIELPYYLAKKKIPHINSEGIMVQPTTENGVKFERFIFDILPYAEIIVVQEVEREEEYAPVKDATGENSPSEVAKKETLFWKSFFSEVGIELEDDKLSKKVEISPLFARTKEEFAKKFSSLDEKTKDRIKSKLKEEDFYLPPLEKLIEFN